MGGNNSSLENRRTAHLNLNKEKRLKLKLINRNLMPLSYYTSALDELPFHNWSDEEMKFVYKDCRENNETFSLHHLMNFKAADKMAMLHLNINSIYWVAAKIMSVFVYFFCIIYF